ncbi:hypothetical protein [Lysobacter sp. P5_B9]
MVTMQPHAQIIDTCFAASPNVRYVAVYLDGKVSLRSREDVQLLGSNESDQYEEIIVNPTLLKLVTQRGNIDCGGVQHVVVRYGMFVALILPIDGGHVTVSFELDSNLDEEIPRVTAVIHGVVPVSTTCGSQADA